jgi:hypothetical protein
MQEERIRLARELVAPRLAEPGSLGALLYGSSVRPYADASSDLDVHLVVEDERLASMDPRERHLAVHHDVTRTAEIWVVSPRALDAMIAPPEADRHRRRLATSVLLHDPAGIVAPIVARACEISEEVREERMRVHYFETTRLGKRIQLAERRDEHDVLRVLAAEMVLAVSKLLCLERRQWPAPVHWVFEELAVAGIPAGLVGALEELLESSTARAARALRGRLDAYLVAEGVAFVRDPRALWSWLGSPRGREATDVWGGESIRR